MDRKKLIMFFFVFFGLILLIWSSWVYTFENVPHITFITIVGFGMAIYCWFAALSEEISLSNLKIELLFLKKKMI